MNAFDISIDPVHEKYIRSFSCKCYLGTDGVFRRSDIRWDQGRWTRFEVAEPVSAPPSGGYVVPLLPIDLHCHGIGQYDFSVMRSEDLPEVNRLAQIEGVDCILTLYLRPERFDETIRFIRDYAALASTGLLPNLRGVALEGPLLGSSGGTPTVARWQPSREQWLELTKCGPLGLQYMIIGPDALMSSSAGPSMAWILRTLVEAGVKPGFGHFDRTAPAASARMIHEGIQIVEEVVGRRSPESIITDHMFNDMPRKFKHAWRTEDDKHERDDYIARFQQTKWSWDTLDELYGEVPAALLRGARDGHLSLCANFDGEHVDLAYSRWLVEALGAERVLGITDRIEKHELAGQALKPKRGSTLLYQDQDLVAAGTQNIDAQIRNMRRIGLTEQQIWQVFGLGPAAVFNYLNDATHQKEPPRRATYMAEDHVRVPIYTHASSTGMAS